MRSLRVTTWNVLHRVHAVNWNEAPVSAFPDERARIAGITEMISGWLERDEDMVVCLQEVSGDQLASLRHVLPRFDVHAHRYPRLPRVRAGGAVLDDATEHLVIVSRAPSSLVESLTFESDPGKGLLAVRVRDDITVIDTHVSFGDRSAAQLAVVRAMAHRAGTPAVITGDFNAPREAVSAGLGEPLSISDLTGQRVTRIATDQHDGKTIDHVAVVGGSIDEAKVLDGRLLSDHQPVTARVRFMAPSD
jgi:endonuclease/exonuclease/phosphatase family metal-dependent hydrolase